MAGARCCSCGGPSRTALPVWASAAGSTQLSPGPFGSDEGRWLWNRGVDGEGEVLDRGQHRARVVDVLQVDRPHQLVDVILRRESGYVGVAEDGRAGVAGYAL